MKNAKPQWCGGWTSEKMRPGIAGVTEMPASDVETVMALLRAAAVLQAIESQKNRDATPSAAAQKLSMMI